MRPKQDFHLILYLKKANKLEKKCKFIMLALHAIFPYLQQGDWMCALNLGMTISMYAFAQVTEIF